MRRFDWSLAFAVWSVTAVIGVTGGVVFGIVQDLLTG